MITFHLYGFLIGAAILTSTSISEKFRKKFSSYQLPATSYQLLWWVLIPGLIGARLYHVLDYWEYYWKNLREIFFIWHGGLGIIGGIIGGIVGLWIFAKIKYKKPNFLDFFLSLLDVVVIGLPVGQAIGRIGNFFNQELYGLPTNLPWGIYIWPENRLLGFEDFRKFHPLFAYEGIWCLMIFFVLLSLIRFRIASLKKGISPGGLFFTYLFLYSFGRFFLEFLRIESWTIQPPLINSYLSVAQIISIIFIIISLGFLAKGKRDGQSQ